MSENENKVQACTLGVGAEILQNYMDACVEQRVSHQQQSSSNPSLDKIGIIALGELTSIGLRWLAKSLGV